MINNLTVTIKDSFHAQSDTARGVLTVNGIIVAECNSWYIDIPAGTYQARIDDNGRMYLENSNIFLDVYTVFTRCGSGWLNREVFVYNCRGQRLLGTNEYTIEKLELDISTNQIRETSQKYREYVEYATSIGREVVKNRPVVSSWFDPSSQEMTFRWQIAADSVVLNNPQWSRIINGTT